MYISKKKLFSLIECLAECQSWVASLLREDDAGGECTTTPVKSTSKRSCLHCGNDFEKKESANDKRSKKFCKEECRRKWWLIEYRKARNISRPDVELRDSADEPVIDAIIASMESEEKINNNVDLFISHKKGPHSSQANRREIDRVDPLDVKFDELTSACVGENLSLEELRELFEDEWPTCYLRARNWRRIGHGMWAAPNDFVASHIGEE